MLASPQTLFRGWRVALLLVAGALLSAQNASATECGSHVTVLNPTAESKHDATPRTDGQGQPAKPPCNGPNCSGAPERHAPPAPPAPTGAPLKALMSGDLISADPSPGGPNRADTTAIPIRRSLSIFHPPRAA